MIDRPVLVHYLVGIKAYRAVVERRRHYPATPSPRVHIGVLVTDDGLTLPGRSLTRDGRIVCGRKAHDSATGAWLFSGVTLPDPDDLCLVCAERYAWIELELIRVGLASNAGADHAS